MNIVCTQCHTSFSVPDGLIPPEGRKVRCANPECRAIFLAVPPADAAPQAAPESLFAGGQPSTAAPAASEAEPFFANPSESAPPAEAPTAPPPPSSFAGLEDTGEFRRTPFAPEEEEALAQADEANRLMGDDSHHRDLLLHEEMFPQNHRLDADGDLSFDFVLPRKSEEETVPEEVAVGEEEPEAAPASPPSSEPEAVAAPEESDRLDPLPLEETAAQEQQWEVENRSEILAEEEEVEPSSAKGKVWRWASVALILLTVGALGWMYRDAALELPAVHGALTSLGLTPAGSVEGIRVTGLDGKGIPQGQLIHSNHLGDLYVIRGKILNDGAQPQALPWLDVTLTNGQGQTVQHLQVLPEDWHEVAPEAMQMIHYTRWLDHATHPRSPWPALAGGKSDDFVVFFRAIDNTLASVSRYAITLIPAPVQ